MYLLLLLLLLLLLTEALYYYTLGPRLRKQELRGLLQFLKLLKENYLLDYLLIALISRFLRAQGRLSLLYFLNVGVS